MGEGSKVWGKGKAYVSAFLTAGPVLGVKGWQDVSICKGTERHFGGTKGSCV